MQKMQTRCDAEHFAPLFSINHRVSITLLPDAKIHFCKATAASPTSARTDRGGGGGVVSALEFFSSFYPFSFKEAAFEIASSTLPTR